MSPALMPPRHYWPTFRPFTNAANRDRRRFPCGRRPDSSLFLVTDDPLEVTCRNCIKSELVQALLSAGRAGEHRPTWSEDALEAWNLIDKRGSECRTCGGRGTVPGGETRAVCGTCHGSGRP